MEPWYKRTFLWGQVNLTENDPAECDMDVWKSYWKETGTEGVVINCSGIVSYYPSRYEGMYQAASLNKRDYFGEWNRMARECGLTVIARMDINCTRKDLYEAHPDWYCMDREGTPVMTQGRYVACVNGGYYHTRIPLILQEIIERYHPDGFADNSWAGPGRDAICYCENCRQQFRQATGFELPEAVNFEDRVYRQWVRWNYELRVHLWKRLNREVREKGGEDCRWFGMINADPFRTGGRFYDIHKLIEDTDFIFCDHQSRDGYCGFEQNALNGQLLKLVCHEDVIVAESMAHYYKGMKTFRLASSESQEVRKWMMTGMSGGISAWYHFVGGVVWDSRKLHISGDLLRLQAQQRKWLTDRVNMADVGVIWNQESSVYYGRDKAMERSALPWMGMTRALSETGIAFLPIHADDIRRYHDRLHTLILPNVAILSDSQEEAVEEWLSAGKNLIITGQTGCYDADGEWKPDSRLLKRIGITIHEKADISESDEEDNWLKEETHTYLKLTDIEHPLFSSLGETRLTAFGGVLQKTCSDGILEVLCINIPCFPIYPPEFAWIREERQDAGIYAGTLAEGGRIVYFAADIDRCYAKYRIPDHQRLLEGAVRYVQADEFAVQAAGPGHISVNAYRKENAVVVHLVNLAGCSVPPGTLTEILPVGPVSVTLNCFSDQALVTARSLLTGITYKTKQVHTKCIISIPRLEEHDMILTEQN